MVMQWFVHWFERWQRSARIPPPPFRASKRVGFIMNRVWYGRLTPDEGREQATQWGFTPDAIDEMIAQATSPPSYWSQQSVTEPHHDVDV